jgi:hypothetical protein
MSPAALAVVAQRRAARDSALNIALLTQAAPEEARAALLANLPALTAATTAEPEAWIITSVATAGHPSVRAEVEIRVVRSGPRLAVMRRRSDS